MSAMPVLSGRAAYVLLIRACGGVVELRVAARAEVRTRSGHTMLLVTTA